MSGGINHKQVSNQALRELTDLQAILIAGPTASGKTALAVEVAKITGGPVINADSMQVYDVLSVVTARPQPEEMAGVEHLLFGHVHPAHAYSVAQYLEEVGPILEDLRKRGIVPVLAGGTGLYFKALLEGLAPVPDIDPKVRQSLRDAQSDDIEGLYRELTELDPEGAKRLRPGDRQRIVRALEVVRSTGKPLSWWQNQGTGERLLNFEHCLKIILLPDRKLLRERAGLRFNQMVKQGGLEEVKELQALDLNAELPAMRAIGVRQLIDHLAGEIDLDMAAERAVNATRQYAKRQSTWFRNQFACENENNALQNWHVVSTPEDALALVLEAI